MWSVLLSVWFKCFIISWVVSAIFLSLTGEPYDVKWHTHSYGIVRGVLYYIFITALLGLGLSLLIFIGLFIAAVVCASFILIFKEVKL